jgi:hypothetical protein
VGTFIEGLRLEIQQEVKARRPQTMKVVLLFARREERLGEKNCQVIKVVDQSTIGKSNSFSTLTCKAPTMQEELTVTKVKVFFFYYY